MKIGILTLPILHNYGGALQAFAIHFFLKKNGFDSLLINHLPVSNSKIKYFFSSIKRLFCLRKHKENNITSFIKKHVACTDAMNCFSSRLVKKNGFDTIIVGSDQVWRPKYCYHIENYYLKFAKKNPINRIAYAASFGVDDWEYTLKQTRKCSRLAKKFDAISVREESGVELCKEKLGVNASWVLDPTLLLTREDYLRICNEIPICTEKYLAVYVLDENKEVTAAYEKESTTRGLVIKKFHADSKSTLTVPEWLALFRDASYVVTDSFHGTVFSIIFGKDFNCIYNRGRGSARFESLLKIYNSGKLDEMRTCSLNWLKNTLEK